MVKILKKTVALILAAVILSASLISCGASEEEHIHSYSQSYSYDEEYHWKECECKDKTERENHSGGAPTCTEAAICEDCGALYGETEPHNYSITKFDEGKHWKECVCGATTSKTAHKPGSVKKNDTHHWRECGCGYKEISVHNSDKTVYYNDSMHWLACTCGYEYEGSDHAVENFHCICGYKAPGWDHVHSFDVLKCDANGHWYECECKERGEFKSHRGGEAGCTEKAVCEVCFVSYGEFKPHSFSTVRINESEHWYECVCSERGEAASHVFTNGVCSCGYSKTQDGHTHDFSILKYNENKHWYECECKVSFSEEGHKGGNATCVEEAKCEVCHQNYGGVSHDFNDGELTTPSTVDTTGTITYTCTYCGEKKNEIVPVSEVILTRADLEAAIVDVAWAYYMKGEKLQYDSAALSAINNHYGGTCRHTREVSPEYGTSDCTIFSVCTGYPTKVYLEAIDRYLWEGKYSANGVVTMWFWLAADNQSEEGFRDYYESEKDPVTENDRDTAVLRWIDYAKYLEDEDNEVPYAISLGTFDSTSFTDWYEGGTLEFKKADGEEEYSYYLNGEKISAEAAKSLALEYLTEKKDGEYVNLRPGDILTEDTHTLLYIGNGYVLDCNGYKYDINSGVDDPEERGAIFGRMKTVKDTLNAAVSDYVVVRAFDYYTKDYDGNPGNDIIKFNGESVGMTDATESRMQYPAMEIDRTVDITRYGTAINGGELTYSIKISNKTDETNFVKWKNVSEKGYFGEDYKDLVVTELIPGGTEFVSASEGYELKNGVLTWKINVSSGSCAELTYTVKVTAEEGSVITSEGGFVDAIPSNSISNSVGYAKLDEAQRQTLFDISESSTEGWATEYGTGIEFVNSIYEKMGVVLDLPSVEDMIENLFTPTYFEKILSMTIYYKDLQDCDEAPIVMYVPQKNVGEDYADVEKMLLYDFFGGYRMYSADLEKFKEQGVENYDFPAELDKMILEFSLDYLEVGDVIVYATAKDRSNEGLSSELASTRILVYAGNGTLIEMSGDGVGRVYVGDAAEELLDASFKNDNDLFFALRPSQTDLSAN